MRTFESPAPSSTAIQGDVAARVRRLRQEMGATQERFAERMLVSPLTVHRWESGQSSPRPLALARLSRLEEEVSVAQASSGQAVPTAGLKSIRRFSRSLADEAPPLDFAGDPDAVSAVAEAYRLA